MRDHGGEERFDFIRAFWHLGDGLAHTLDAELLEGRRAVDGFQACGTTSKAMVVRAAAS